MFFSHAYAQCAKKTRFAISYQPRQLPQNKHFYFFFFLLIKPTNEGAQSGYLCILNTFTPLSTPVEILGSGFSSQLRHYEQRTTGLSFPFAAFREQWRETRAWEFGGSAVFVVRARVHEGPSAALHTVHLAFSLSETPSATRTIT